MNKDVIYAHNIETGVHFARHIFFPVRLLTLLNKVSSRRQHSQVVRGPDLNLGSSGFKSFSEYQTGVDRLQFTCSYSVMLVNTVPLELVCLLPVELYRHACFSVY